RQLWQRFCETAQACQKPPGLIVFKDWAGEARPQPARHVRSARRPAAYTSTIWLQPLQRWPLFLLLWNFRHVWAFSGSSALFFLNCSASFLFSFLVCPLSPEPGWPLLCPFVPCIPRSFSALAIWS